MSKAKRLAALLLSGLLLIGPAGCHKEPQKPEVPAFTVLKDMLVKKLNEAESDWM